MKTMWLSFVDPGKPAGERFLGVSIVQIDEDDEADALARFPDMYDKERGPQIVAACQKAHAMGCNPGGEVQGMLLPEEEAGNYPLYQLLSKQDLQDRGLI